MTFKIKRQKNFFNKENSIFFVYDARLNVINGVFDNFDIGNEEELIDSILKEINDDMLKQNNSSNRPYYITLSIILFSQLQNIVSIEYVTDNYVSIISRDEINKYI